MTSAAPSDRSQPARAERGGSATTEVRAFGPLTVMRDGSEIRARLDGPGRALRYLVAAGRPVRVEELVDVLWPDTDEITGRIRLRTLLSRAKGAYGPVLVREASVIRWADDVTVDSHRFAQLARTVLVEHADDSTRLAREAIALYSADLLPLARYADWAITARERLRQRYLDLLALLVDDAVERDDLPLAIAYARDIVDTDPLDEAGYVRLSRLHLDAGHPGAARETVAAARRAAAELGLPVSAELMRVERRLPGPAASGS